MSRYLRSAAVAVAALFLVATAASAAPILQVSGGMLTGATGVDVNGMLYDVEFLGGTCIGVFSGCDDGADFAFDTSAEADAAAAALLAQVFVDGPPGNFDTHPELTRGCSDRICDSFIPYGVPSSFANVSVVQNLQVESVDGVGGALVPTNLDTGLYNFYTFAGFTPASPTVPAVPEPTSLSLLGLGLVGVDARRWRQRRDERRVSTGSADGSVSSCRPSS